MTAPPLTKNFANCRKKRRYADEFGARGGAQYFCKARAIPRVCVYRCPCFRGWHFTRKRKAERYMVTERQLLITEGVRHDDRAFSYRPGGAVQHRHLCAAERRVHKKKHQKGRHLD